MLIKGPVKDFQTFMARFKNMCPVDMSTMKRPVFNVTRFKLWLESKTTMGAGFKCVYMHMKQYMEFAQSVTGGEYTLQEATAQWQLWETSRDQHIKKDNKGPRGCLRVAVHVEDNVHGYEELASGKTVEQQHEANNVRTRCMHGRGCGHWRRWYQRFR